MCCIVLLLENIDSLMQFAQQCYGFMCDLGVIINIYKGQFYTLYNDGRFSFSNDEF
jgi:hypothetical protein